jgi:hypothetical protein
MKSGFTSTQIGRLRTRPQRATWYLCVHRPGSLVSARLDAAPVSYPVSAISINSLVGSSELTDDHQTIWIGTTAGGSQKGRIRLRKAMTATSLLYVSEAGSGLVNWATNDYVTVMNEFAAWTKHPRYDTATSQWLIDYDEAYDDQLENYGPLIKMSVPFVGFLEGGAVTASFLGASTNFLDGATFDSASWVLPGALTTPSSLGTITDPIVHTFTNSFVNGTYTTLKVVDSTGASNKSKRLAFVFDDRTQPHRVEFGQVTGGLRTGGYETELRVLSNATSATFPDMAEVLIFEEASFGTVGSSIGGNSPFRANVVMRGWIIGDTVRVNPFHGDVSFRIRTIDGIMRETYSYDTFLANASAFPSGSNWIGASSLTIDRAAIHLLKHRSTVGDLVDFNLASGIAMTESIAFQSLPAGNWWDQLTINYGEKGLAGYVSADMQSNIFASLDAQISGTSANLPVAMHIARQDRRDQVVIDRMPIEKLAEVQVYSVTGATEDTASRIGALSPGDVKGYFGGLREHARGLFLSSQDLAITWAGNMRAKGNNPYPKTIVPLAGNYRIDSVPQMRITMSLSSTDNPREISWNDETFLPYETRLTYDSRAGMVLSEIEMEKVVQGIGGSAITVPLVTVAPSDEPPSTPPPPDPPLPQPGSGFGSVYVATNERIGRTRDFSQSSPVWTTIGTSQATFGGCINDFILDPWRPKTTAYAMTVAGLYRSSTMTDNSPSWSLVLSAAEIATGCGRALGAASGTCHRVMGSINEDGYVAVSMGMTDNTRYYAHSHDNGATWTFALVGNGADGAVRYAGAGDIVPWTIDSNLRVFVPVSRQTGPFQRPWMYRSLNHGHSFTEVGQLESANNSTRATSTPYEGNEDGQIVYAGGVPNGQVMKSTDGGISFASVSPTNPTVKRYGVEAFTQNSDRMYVWGIGPTLTITDDAFATSSIVTTTGIIGSSIRASGGFPYNQSLFYLVTVSGIHASIDRGSTWMNKNGNWPTKANGTRELGDGYNVGAAELAFGHAIVPIWVAE